MNRKLIIYFVFALVVLSDSVVAQGQVYFNNLEDPLVEGNWIGLNTVDSGLAYSGWHYSQTDSLRPYGLGIEQAFPAGLARANTKVLISGRVKSNVKNNNALFVVTLVNGEETLFWKGIPLAPILNGENIWCYFSDSTLIPADLTSKSKLKAYLWNNDGKSSTGIDDLRVEFKAMDNPTFIPKITNSSPNIVDEETKSVLFTNQYYSVRYALPGNVLSIVGNTDGIIVDNIVYYSEREVKGDKSQSQLKWRFTGSNKTKNGKKLNFKASNRNGRIKLAVICNDNSQEIQFVVEEKYRKKQTVSRESLIFDCSQPLSEVYRNNRKLDTNLFQKEYWLDKQGVKIGEGNNSLIVYHVPEISSLQLDAENNLLFVNLDYEKDHPFFRFPLNPDSTDWKKEESASRYKKGDKRKYRFNLVAGNSTRTLPRFMKSPSGFEATYIWTEHADFTDIRTNRATYFGSEKVSRHDSAIGGFVKFNVPVTKSVFYDNPDSITNHDASGGVFTSYESTIMTDSPFSDFLFQIAGRGNEICLHTPEQFTTTPKRLEEALAYMQTNFGSPSWIDHGNNNGPQSNREDLVCDGTLEHSPFFAIDLWDKYGVKYLHNAYYEEFDTYNGWQFESSIEKPHNGFGDFFPKPDYYRHPTRTRNLIHWPTTSALFVKDPNLWDYLFNTKKLQNLVDNRIVEINHCYPPWANPKKGMWTYGNDSTIIAQPGFNQALANMAQLRDDGKLNVCTIEDFLDYRTAIDKIAYRVLPDGRIRLTNNGNVDIKKLSMVAKAKAVTVNGLIPKQKKVGDEIIFWFDVGAGEIKIIRVTKLM